MTRAEFHVHDDVLELLAPEVLDIGTVEEMFRRLAELRQRHARPFLLVRNGGPTMTTATRRAVTQGIKAASEPFECATYGGGMVQRVVVDMTRRAVELLTPGKLILASCKTRQEAVAWIDARRRLPPPGR